MSQSFRDLFDALHNDDRDSFSSQLLTHGWPKNFQWPDYHLLAEAIKFGRKNVANFLLELKSRVTKPGNRNTFVHKALTYPGWTNIVVKLIELGAPVDSINAEGDTAIHVAFQNNADGKLIDRLLDTYVACTLEKRENMKNADGLSILHIACSRPSLEVVEMLTRRNARVIVPSDDINRRVQCSRKTGYSGYTPLHFAVKNGHTETVKFFIRNLPVDLYKVDDNCSTPLHLALERGDIEMLECLLSHDKLHVDVVNNAGMSHFMAACAAGNASIVARYLRLAQHRPWMSPESLFSKRTAESGDSPYRGYSALHFAAEFGRLDAVQLLLDHGASCFETSAENLTPLVLAVKRGHEDVYRLLWRGYKAYRQAIYDDIDERRRAASGESGGTELTSRLSSGPASCSGHLNKSSTMRSLERKICFKTSQPRSRHDAVCSFLLDLKRALLMN